MRENILTKVLNWLRVGYPEGIPTKDYNPLLALLERTLTNEELDAVVERIAAARAKREGITAETIKQEIADVTKADANLDEVHQVAARLAAAGWPLAEPDAVA